MNKQRNDVSVNPLNSISYESYVKGKQYRRAPVCLCRLLGDIAANIFQYISIILEKKSQFVEIEDCRPWYKFQISKIAELLDYGFDAVRNSIRKLRKLGFLEARKLSSQSITDQTLCYSINDKKIVEALIVYENKPKRSKASRANTVSKHNKVTPVKIPYVSPVDKSVENLLISGQDSGKNTLRTPVDSSTVDNLVINEETLLQNAMRRSADDPTYPGKNTLRTPVKIPYSLTYNYSYNSSYNQERFKKEKKEIVKERKERNPSLTSSLLSDASILTTHSKDLSIDISEQPAISKMETTTQSVTDRDHLKTSDDDFANQWKRLQNSKQDLVKVEKLPSEVYERAPIERIVSETTDEPIQAKSSTALVPWVSDDEEDYVDPKIALAAFEEMKKGLRSGSRPVKTNQTVVNYDLHKAKTIACKVDDLSVEMDIDMFDSENTTPNCAVFLGEVAPNVIVVKKPHKNATDPTKGVPKGTVREFSKLDPETQLTDAWKNVALNVGIHEDYVFEEFDSFKQYWLEEARGIKALKKNWHATWINWVRNTIGRFPIRTKQKAEHMKKFDPSAKSIDEKFKIHMEEIKKQDQRLLAMRRILFKEMGDAVYKSWIMNHGLTIDPRSKEDDVRFILHVNNQFERDMILRKHTELFKRLKIWIEGGG